MTRQFVIVRGILSNDPRATEYRLPCSDMPEEIRRMLHPCLRTILGKSVSDVTSRLEQSWEKVADASLRRLRDRLLEFEPRSIVVYKDEAFLGVHRAGQAERNFYIPPQLDESTISETVGRLESLRAL